MTQLQKALKLNSKLVAKVNSGKLEESSPLFTIQTQKLEGLVFSLSEEDQDSYFNLAEQV